MFFVEVLGELIFSLMAHVRHLRRFCFSFGWQEAQFQKEQKDFRHCLRLLET